MFLVRAGWMLFKTITAFTVAHSITLGVTTFGLVEAPADLVNALVALSILFLALEVMRRYRGGTSLTIEHPWLVAFAFGLLRDRTGYYTTTLMPFRPTTSSGEGDERLLELFARACEVEGPEREELLRRECGEDLELRRELDSLLAHDREPPALFPRGAGWAEDLAEGARIEDYTVIRLLGSGGMGMVYLAREEKRGELVALKVLRGTSPDLLKRFQREVGALRRLEHPGIARVLGSGTFEQGEVMRPFFAMEYVDGIPLTSHARERKHSLEGRLELVLQVCTAVHHAHDRHVVHRDLKPGNILVDLEGRVKVLDFGVARVIDPDSQLESLHTRPGQLLGTLPYMSPEQVAGDPGAVDMRSDVYALGVLLFEVLTGKLPLDIESRSLPEAARIIREEPARRPSSFEPSLRGDLEVILECALRKEPAQRYASARDLAKDLERYLAGDPIHARRATPVQRMARFVRRYRLLTASVLSIMTVLTVALGVSIWQTRLADDARSLAEEHSREARRESYRATLSAASASLRAGEPVIARELLDSVDVPERHFEWHYYRAQLDQCLAFSRQPGLVAATLNEDASVVITLTTDGWRTRRAVPSMEVLDQVDLDSGEVLGASFSPNADRIAVVSGNPGRVVLFDVASGRQVDATRELPAVPGHVAWNETGDRVAWVDEERQLRTWTPGSAGEPLSLGHFKGARTPSRIVMHGTRIAVAGQHGYVTIADAADEPATTRKLVVRANLVMALAWSPDGSRLALGCRDNSILVVDVSPGPLDESRRSPSLIDEDLDERVEQHLRGHHGSVQVLAFRADGRSLISAAADQVVRIWNLETGRSEVLTGHDDGIRDLTLSRQGARILTTDEGDGVRVWSAEDREEVHTLTDHEHFVYTLQASPSSRWLASAGWDHQLRLWDLATGQGLGTHSVGAVARDIQWSADESRIAVALQFQGATILDPLGAEAPKGIEAGLHRVQAIGWLSPTRVVVGGRPKGVEGNTTLVFDLDQDRPLGPLVGATEAVIDLCVAPDRSWVALASDSGAAGVWDARTLEPRWRRNLESGITAIAADPSGRWVACSFHEEGAGSVWILDLSTGETVSVLEHPAGVWDLAFHPDGSRLATAGQDTFVRLFETESGLAVAQLRGHTDYVKTLAFSGDGRFLISGSGDRTARIWDTRPVRERLAARFALGGQGR